MKQDFFLKIFSIIAELLQLTDLFALFYFGLKAGLFKRVNLSSWIFAAAKYEIDVFNIFFFLIYT